VWHLLPYEKLTAADRHGGTLIGRQRGAICALGGHRAFMTLPNHVVTVGGTGVQGLPATVRSR